MNAITWIFVLYLLVLPPGWNHGEKETERIVVTVDDLPLNTLSDDINYQSQITERIVSTLKAHDVPAVGFVNEEKLYTGNGDKPNEAMTDLLRTWLNAGLELGNHTYSHPDYHHTNFETFKQEIIRGEQVTNDLLEQKGKRVRYFRHPMLHVGDTPEKKEALENFLLDYGYTAAPVTIDNSEWIFARAYERALLVGDRAMMQKIGEAYVPYMEDKIVYYEQQSKALFGRTIPQVLLLHANALNGDYLDDLLVMLEDRDYQFISLEEALQDSAFDSPDSYTGPAGISWIHRWAITQGKSGAFFAGEPEAPEFVIDYSGLGGE